MSINSVDDLISGLTNSSQHADYLKVAPAVPNAIGAFVSGWMATGNPAAGVASPAFFSGSDYTCNSGTVGAFSIRDGSFQNFLAKVTTSCTQAGTLVFADRLWSCSTISGTIQTTMTINNPGSLPSRVTDNGIGCELWIEHFVATGVATGTLTATYVNPVGQTGRTGTLATVQSAAAIGRFQNVQLQSGDNGISQLTSIIKTNTWTSGTFGATIIKRVLEIPLPIANTGDVFDWAETALKQLPDNVCLMFFFLPSVAASYTVFGSIDIIDK